MSWGCKCKLYVPLDIEILKCETDELWSVVCENFMQNSKPAYNIFPNEFFYVCVSDLVECFCFNPLCEVVCQHEHIDYLARCDWHFPYYVHPSFHELPRRGDGCQSFGRLVRHSSESLAFITFLHEVFCIFSERWLVVSSCDDFVCKASRSGMVSTFTFVEFRNNVFLPAMA